MRHPDGHCQDCGERQTAETTNGTVCANGHSDNGGGSEHLLEETRGTFTTVYECRHCGERSPDEEYFEEIPCPPSIVDA